MKSQLFAAVIASIALSGCMGTPEQIIGKFEKKLGIEIEFNGYPKDDCVKEQLLSLYGEYSSLTKSQKNDFEQKLRDSYKRIVINGTEEMQTVRGHVFKLTNYTIVCNPGCKKTLFKNKIIVDSRKVEGTSPAATLDKREALVLTTGMKVDRTDHLMLYTSDFDTYDRIDTFEELEAYGRGYVNSGEIDSDPKVTCGTRVSLSDLLK